MKIFQFFGINQVLIQLKIKGAKKGVWREGLNNENIKKEKTKPLFPKKE